MTEQSPKRILVICRKAPYGSSLSREALDIVLAASVFEQQLALLFTGDGVWQLLNEQNSEAIESKNHSNMLSVFPLYDINDIFVDSEALAQRQISAEQLSLPAKPLAADQLASFSAGFDVVLSF
jgi:tRNA 2-thiouridine synthesizing protein C